jgi:hypothetical protein
MSGLQNRSPIVAPSAKAGDGRSERKALGSLRRWITNTKKGIAYLKIEIESQEKLLAELREILARRYGKSE